MTQNYFLTDIVGDRWEERNAAEILPVLMLLTERARITLIVPNALKDRTIFGNEEDSR
jgi:hypothetical protein